VRVQFWSTTSQVNYCRFDLINELNHLPDGIDLHLLFAVWAGIDVAVKASLITSITEVDLNGFELFPVNGWELSVIKK
jgi:hypothetical protein